MDPLDPNIKKLLQIDDFDTPDGDDDIDEAGLEDELASFLSGGGPKPAARKPAAKPAARKVPGPTVNNVKKTSNNIQKSAQQQQQPGGEEPDEMEAFDIGNIQEMLNKFDVEEPEDEEVDENDPDLLSELSDVLSGKAAQPLPKRDKKSAAPPPARVAPPPPPEPEKDEEPPAPEVPQRPAPVAPSRPAPEAPKPAPEPVAQPTEADLNKAKIKNLQVEYKKAALKAKTSGDKTSALNFIKVSKHLDSMLNALNSGETVDMSQLPPKPEDFKMPDPTAVIPDVDPNDPELQLNSDDAAKLFNAPTSAGSVMEALEQRLTKFQSTQQQAQAENNSSKARRVGRIVKQYQTAIKDYKAGKPVNFDELPCPPGFPPIPVETKPAPAAPKKAAAAAPQKAATVAPKPAASGPVPAAPSAAARPPLKKQMSTTATKQLHYLLERQKLFREAAIEAKKRGEIEQAKEYLRNAKGFDNLIEATRSGLPIDASSIPIPPQLKEDFVVSSRPLEDDSLSNLSGKKSRGESASDIGDDEEREEMYEKIENELKKQIEMCIRNQEYFLKMGDIPTSSKFEKYAKDSKKDLHMLKIRRRNGDSIPSFRVETRTFTIVVANLDVPLNELHVEVVRAFDFTGTPEIDTYVRADFPFPAEAPQWKRTKTFHDSLTPEYNDTLRFEIDRKSRALPRIIKRHPLKLTVYAKGGWFRSDSPIGTVLVKLNDLETKCTIHECSGWTQGRKVINGQLEVKVKLREPLLAKQIEEIKEKWIVFE